MVAHWLKTGAQTQVWNTGWKPVCIGQGTAVAIFGAAFQIGRSALTAYQAALNVTGQNIANAGNTDYTPQTGRLVAENGGYISAGVMPGGGVRLSELERHIDESLESRLRFANSTLHRTDELYKALSQTESNYNELSDSDMST